MQTMPSRPHPKSRFGCAECKRRRVKCDEVHPICGSCKFRSASCVFPTPRSSPAVSRLAGSTSSASSSSNLEDALSRSLVLSSTPSPNPPPPTIAFSVQELELIHHYACHTYRSLSDSPAFDFTWRETVPKAAFSYPFLLHGVLAVSALHLAHLSPHGPKKQTSRRLARQYYTSAIALFHGPLNQIEPENSHAVFAFSVLAAIVGIGLRQAGDEEHENLTDPIDVLLESMALTTGVRAIVDKSLHWLERGPMADLVQWDREDDSIPLAPTVDAALKRLDGQNMSTLEKDGPCNQAGYAKVIARLRSTFQLATMRPNSIGVILSWQASVSQEYIMALRERTRMAVIIVAYYGVLLDRLCHCWWAAGLGRRVVAAVVERSKDNQDELLEWVLGSIL